MIFIFGKGGGKVHTFNIFDKKLRFYFIKGKKVMLDRDLAELYGVDTKVLNQAVRRNINRFPEDFMFEICNEENLLILNTGFLRSQIVTSNRALNKALKLKKVGRGGQRYLPLTFTEQGIAMLSSVLNSDRAIQINIQIIRVFTKLRDPVGDSAESDDRCLQRTPRKGRRIGKEQ
ncbi:MAG: ORF6N domain-containing protein [Candidatus Paceibacterota bacterium]|jgi:hypothetical protein